MTIPSFGLAITNGTTSLSNVGDDQMYLKMHLVVLKNLRDQDSRKKEINNFWKDKWSSQRKTIGY